MERDDHVDAAVTATLATAADLVAAVRDGRPKAWGTLAARGVVTFRERTGRAPTDQERRAIWSGLWHAAHQDG